MQNQAPGVDSAWNWLIGIIPPDLRPIVGLIAVVGILIWLAAKFITGLLEAWKAYRDAQDRRRRAKEPEAELTPIPSQPRVSIWNREVREGQAVRPITGAENGIPIVTVANMKGGVGKTTLTANLAAQWDKSGKRVLLIDLDYQGSLSQTALAAANISKMGSVVDDLIRGSGSMGAVLQASQTLLPALPHSRILTCYYEFADTEAHEMVNWLSELNRGGNPPDIRFRLAGLLRDAAVQSNYDVVLIDAPPRFTTGAVNALCASTHVLIPTLLDRMSAEAVVYFSRDIAAMRNRLFPSLKLVGVVPTLIHQATGLLEREQASVDYLNASLQGYWGAKTSVITEASVPRVTAISDIAGTGIGYYDAGDGRKTRRVRAIFDAVAPLIWNRIQA